MTACRISPVHRTTIPKADPEFGLVALARPSPSRLRRSCPRFGKSCGSPPTACCDLPLTRGGISVDLVRARQAAPIGSHAGAAAQWHHRLLRACDLVWPLLSTNEFLASVQRP